MKFLLALFIALFVVLFSMVIFGWHYEVSEGQHTGYITSAETNGIFFKTHRVYVKSDVQSSQEDAYCVVDGEVFETLKSKVSSREVVTVSYIDWLSPGVAYCSADSEIGVIQSVK